MKRRVAFWNVERELGKLKTNNRKICEHGLGAYFSNVIYSVNAMF